jgi:hypothetical protein
VADKKTEKDPKSATAKPGFDPKPVQVGGESILERLVPHMKKIVVALVAVVAVLSVYFTIRYFQDKKHAAGTERLQHVLATAAIPVASPTTPVDPKADPKPFANYKERANAVLDALAKANTDVAGPVYRASLLVQAGKLDDAIAEYKKAQGKTGLEGALAREGLGIAIEMKAEAEKDAAARQKGLETALDTFKSMQPDEQGPRRAFAFYHQGRILGLLGKTDEAKAALEKAKELGKGTDVEELADQRIASLGG